MTPPVLCRLPCVQLLWYSFAVNSATQQSVKFEENTAVMEKKAFVAAVKMRSRVSEDCLDEAIDFCEKYAWMRHNGDVVMCIELAGRFEAFRANAPAQPGMSEHRLEPLTPGMIIVSDELTRHITSSVELVRQVFFGSTDAPFSSYEEVATWLEEMGQHQAYTCRYKECSVNGQITYNPKLIVQNPERDQQLQALERKICELYTQWGELTGEAVPPSFPPKYRYLPYLRRDGKGRLWPEEFPACAGSRLAKLYDRSYSMAEATGFSQLSVVMYILMGTKPLLSPFTVRFERKPSPTFDVVRVQATIKIETPDITDEQWRAIRQELRQAWGIDNTTRLDEDDQRLQSIVEQLGGVPQRRGKMTFWEKACQEWNRQERQKAELKQQQGCTYALNLHKNGKTTRMRYDRLTQKLATQVSGAEKQWSSTMTLQSVTNWDGIRSRRILARQLSRNNTQK
jgi:hypothetical protein